MNHFAGAPAIPLWQHRWLIYFRADLSTRTYPNDPFQITSPAISAPGTSKKHSLVLVPPSGEVTEWSIDCPSELWSSMDMVARMIPANVDRVSTIHAASLLGRIFRWHARLRHLELRPAFCPPQLRDIVDDVNSPAVLSVNMRLGFNLAEFERVLGLTPVPGYDQETGLLLNLIHNYGS